VAVGDKGGVALVLNDLADLETRRGNLAAAEAYLERGQSVAAEVGDKSVMAYLAQQMGAVYRERAEYEKSRQSYDRAKALRVELGETQSVGQSNLALGELSLDQGSSLVAEKAARDADAQFIQHKQADDQLAAETLIVRALVSQGKATDALSQVEATKTLAGKSDNLLQRLRFDLESARAQAAAGHLEAARAQLQRTISLAHAKEFIPLELESRIELAKQTPKTHAASASADLNANHTLAAERRLFRIANLCEPQSSRQNWM
jgi:hypothetical protein